MNEEAKLEQKKKWKEYVEEGRKARESRDNAQWKLGDLAKVVITHYGETEIEKYADDVGVSYGRLRRYKIVSLKFQYDRHRSYLPWCYYDEVTREYITLEEAIRWLEKAKQDNWSVMELRKQIKLAFEKPYEPLPEGIFDVIYADPPWSFNNWTSFSPTEHYRTLSKEKITELKKLLNDKLGKNAVLFLWTPNGILEEALEVMEAWGFQYKTNIVWVKDHPLMGYYTKSQHELLLIGVKGNIGTPDEEDKPPSTILFTKANRRHSEKPEEVYNIIETMYPSHKYLELFARNKRENWKSWGNEVEN